MFETLEEQIEKTESELRSTGTRAVRYATAVVLTAIVGAILFAATMFLE